MGKLIVAQIVATLKNILHDILKITPSSGRRRFTPKLVECLTAACDVSLESLVASIARFIGKLGANVDYICHSEPIPHTVARRVYRIAELSDNLEKC